MIVVDPSIVSQPLLCCFNPSVLADLFNVVRRITVFAAPGIGSIVPAFFKVVVASTV
ncbi:ATPase component [Pseudomonas syringae pv. actinidiae]|uniref:ATPase component n=1 Tax=Pseudomonas syringae pv. actinidiae TaxID=103796 RepID=A0A2V0QW94_PSESF|nr:ATPase component [Pseudomonas syringae pv. actinidiae]